MLLSVFFFYLILIPIVSFSIGIEQNFYQKIVQISWQNWTTGLSYNVCGATIISDDVIVSAAHCFYNENGRIQNIKEFTFLLNSENGKISKIQVAELLIHPDFNYSAKVNDIALIRTPFPITSGISNIYPLPIEPVGLNSLSESECYHVGYDSKTTLQQISVIYDETNSCKLQNGQIMKTNLICGLNLREEVHPGYSGYPLVCLNKNNSPIISGFLSYSHNFENKYVYPVFYTNISFYQDWIGNTLKVNQGIRKIVKSLYIFVAMFGVVCILILVYFQFKSHIGSKENINLDNSV